mmetsp:Transcript_9377/g.31009  ORF Transcript_9377/g.31009 Transcript_9377/m.31009 type:complete len:152 (-) Transcript_9377:54-509(-)
MERAADAENTAPPENAAPRCSPISKKASRSSSAHHATRAHRATTAEFKVYQVLDENLDIDVHIDNGASPLPRVQEQQLAISRALVAHSRLLNAEDDFAQIAGVGFSANRSNEANDDFVGALLGCSSGRGYDDFVPDGDRPESCTADLCSVS